MPAKLLAIVEVDHDARIRCQAPGCTRSVHKAVHVISDDGRLVVFGSSCSAEHFGFGARNPTVPRYGNRKGRRLSVDERDMLIHSTAALVIRMEAEHAATLAHRAGIAKVDARTRQHSVQRAAAGEDSGVSQQRPTDRQCEPPQGRDWRRPISMPTGVDPLSVYRAQQARKAASVAMKRLPALASYSLQDVADAMVQARQHCLARGLRLDVDGAREAIEVEALTQPAANRQG